MNASEMDFPIQSFGIDHYTLIVPNAKKVSDFHQHVLGYQHINTILVNAGSVPEGEYDMLNYVLAWPNNKKGVLVITEGLTEESIFHQFMMKFGQGIHHIAFEVEQITEVFEQLKQKGIEVTSEHLLRDPLSGLKQFFISNEYTGIFIELIERKSENESESKETEEQGFFTQDNMSGLASTMKTYLDETTEKNTDVKAVDTRRYFDEGHDISIAQISGLTLHVQEQEKARAFLSDILGFEAQGEHMINPNEPDKSIRFEAMGERDEALIPAQLFLQSSNQPANKSILETLGLSFQEVGKQLILSEEYSGYPLILTHD